ncbi:MAG TPA: carbonic anhydrase [Streptosporangiaceae bacterium]|nr:carbonic anhydrase [Streptosporangiaceae bacterium]
MPATPPPTRMALLTCMDPRVDVTGILGHRASETFVLRNGGGRVTDDVERSLALCTQVLDVTEVGVVHHTDCRLQQFSNEELAARTGIDIDFRPITSPLDAITEDLDRLRRSPAVGRQVSIWGALYRLDIQTVEVLP